MKKQKINIQTAILLTAALLGTASSTTAQNVSISPTGNAPDNSAALDIRDYTDKGVLIPRIALTGTTSAGPISNPANSLLVYNTTNNPAAGLTPGYYYNAGTTTSPIWVRLLNGGTPSDAWLTLGNAGTNSGLNFIGTTDNRSLRFRTNNVHRVVIDSLGRVGIGTTGPEGSLDVARGAGEAQADATSGYLPYGTEKSDLILERLHSPTKSLNGYPAPLIDLRARNTLGEIWSVAQILGVADLNVSGGYAGGLAFLTSAGGIVDPAGRRTKGSAPVTRMIIDANGNVGIGTTSPSEKVEINGRLFLNYAGTPAIRLRTNVNFGGSTKGITEHRIFGPYNAPAGNLGALYIGVGKSNNDTKNDIIVYNDACAGPGGTYDCNVRRILLLGDTIYASGNVGIGTIAPDTKLSIIGGRLRVGQGNPSDGYIRLGTSKGSIIGTNGGASVNYNGLWLGVNETNPNIQADMTLPSWAVDIGGFNNITFPGTSDAFRVARKPAGGSYSEFMRITNSGNVGIGTTTPNERLSVVGNICATGNINGNSATCGSDIRWKKDLKPLENTLEKISQLKPVYYYWKKDEFPDKYFTDKRQIGLIAQDMQKVFPELVVEDKEGYLSVDYSRFTSVLLKAIQEQQQIIHEQQQQIHDQQKVIQELQAENAQIKAENAQTKSEVKALAEKMNILINTLSAEKKVGNK